MHLNDTHLLLLSTAAQRGDTLLVRPDKPGTKATDRMATRFEAAGLVEAVVVTANQPHWRSDPDGGRIGLRLLKAGFDAIGIEQDDVSSQAVEVVAKPVDISAADASPPRTTKRAMLIGMLQRDEGASVEAIMNATGWLPHTTRAALTGLRKAGHDLVKRKDEANRTIYRIAAPQAGAPANTVGG